VNSDTSLYSRVGFDTCPRGEGDSEPNVAPLLIRLDGADQFQPRRAIGVEEKLVTAEEGRLQIWGRLHGNVRQLVGAPPASSDEATWRRLDDLYRPLIGRWLLRDPSLREEADDVIQEVMDVLVRELPGEPLTSHVGKLGMASGRRAQARRWGSCRLQRRRGAVSIQAQRA
jgi:hypothetical protein